MDKSADGFLICFVRIDPAGVDFGFFQGLAHVLFHALAKFLVVWRAQLGKGPSPHKGLIQQVFLVAAGNLLAVETGFLFLVDAVPSGDAGFPFFWQFREHMDARTHVLTPFRVMSGGGG